MKYPWLSQQSRAQALFPALVMLRPSLPNLSKSGTSQHLSRTAHNSLANGSEVQLGISRGGRKDPFHLSVEKMSEPQADYSVEKGKIKTNIRFPKMQLRTTLVVKKDRKESSHLLLPRHNPLSQLQRSGSSVSTAVPQVLPAASQSKRDIGCGHYLCKGM